MDQRFSTRDAHHRCAALIDCLKTLLRCQALIQGFFGKLDLAATKTFQITSEERFQHQDEGVAPPPLYLLG
jgi:hypothetical protein